MPKPLSKKKVHSILDLMKKIVVAGKDINLSVADFINELRQVESEICQRLAASTEDLAKLAEVLEKAGNMPDAAVKAEKAKEVLEDSAVSHMFFFQLVSQMADELHSWRLLNRASQAKKPEAGKHPEKK